MDLYKLLHIAFKLFITFKRRLFVNIYKMRVF